MGPKTRRLPQATVQAMLWDSVQAGDVQGAVQACVGGADLNAPFQTDAAAHLVEDAEVRCHKLSSRDSGARGQQLGDAPPPAALRGDFSIVHCACQVDLLSASLDASVPPRLPPPPPRAFSLRLPFVVSPVERLVGMGMLWDILLPTRSRTGRGTNVVGF